MVEWIEVAGLVCFAILLALTALEVVARVKGGS